MITTRHKGVVLIYVMVAMTVLIGFVSLALDYAHVRIVRAELQFAADSAVRAGAAQISTSPSAALTAAIAAAATNSADGTAVNLNQATDIQFGTWSGTNFTVLTGAAQANANAISVTTRRTAATGNAIHLWFGTLLGFSSFDETTTSIAKYAPGIPYGVTGVNSVSAQTHLFVGSYDSAATTSPSQASHNSNAKIYSNGTVSGSGQFYGDVDLGPSGSESGFVVNGSVVTGTTITAPTVTMQVVTNPGGISASPSLGGNNTWPGGTYYLTSLSMDVGTTLNFSGPAIIYLDGSANILNNCVVSPYSNLPLNLIIYQSAGNTFAIKNNGSFTGCLITPDSDFSMQDNDDWNGSIFAKTFSVHANDNVFVDEEIKRTAGNLISVVQ